MTTTDQTKVGSARQDRSHAVLWAFGALVVAALAVGAIVATLRGSTALDPTTPEGVVQAYLQAWRAMVPGAVEIDVYREVEGG